MKKNTIFDTTFLIIRLIIYIILLVVIIYLINNKLYFMCYWKENFNILCPSCGATRATLSIFKGSLMKAYNYNELYTLVLFPLALVFILDDLTMLVLRCLKITKRKSLIECIFEVDGD